MSAIKMDYFADEILRVSAPAKINLHLEILGLRNDGFHELAMVMQSIDLADELDFQKTNDGLISLSCDDSSLSTEKENLVIKAAELLRKISEQKVGASIHLRKRIPIGAGLAGGSADGAAALLGLNYLWGLQLTVSQLEKLSAELGSDVPFCLEGGTQLCFGRGECLEKLNSGDTSIAVLLVKDPRVSVSTPWAYGRSKKLFSSSYLNDEHDFEERRKLLREVTWFKGVPSNQRISIRNDLQRVVAPETQAVQSALEILSEMPGSLAVAMSGSGPSCFALYPDLKSAEAANYQFRRQLKAAGLKSWCCSFRKQGVRFLK